MTNFGNLGDLTNLDNLYDTGKVEGTKNIQILFDKGLARRLRDDLELKPEDIRELRSIAGSKYRIQTISPYGLVKNSSGYESFNTGLLRDCRVSGFSLTLTPLDLENLDKDEGELDDDELDDDERRIVTYNSMNVTDYRHSKKLEGLFRTYLEFVIGRLQAR